MTANRRIHTRLNKIETLLYDNGFLTVEQLSDYCSVSVATVRRDLQLLVDQDQILRFHGGAKLKSQKSILPQKDNELRVGEKRDVFKEFDALIVTSIDTTSDEPLLQQFHREGKPIIAESLAASYGTTVVAIDNYQAGIELGRWVGNYSKKNWGGSVNYLDLTYHLTNTQDRSQGFIDGLRQILPKAKEILSVNAQSNYNLAYQLTTDAMTVHEDINIIFAINDTCANGAVKACRDLSIDPSSVIVIPFGLEGNTSRNLLAEGSYCKVGLAMFPEIVGKICVQAAIEAQMGASIPAEIVTPYKVLTPQSLNEFYKLVDEDWQFLWESVDESFDLPLKISNNSERLPQKIKIGFTIRYSAHEWYQNLLAIMEEQTALLNLDFKIIDIDQTLKDELVVRRSEIAKRAAAEIKKGDIIIIDSGPISTHLAREILEIDDITVITNNQSVLEVLKGSQNITLMSTGGVVRRNGFAMVGPIAETVMAELRADKLFLMVSGINPGFGLTHDNASEITIKRMMIKSAREIILLADHACFRNESVIRFSPFKAINKLITDEALPASSRLEINKLGVQVCVA